MVENPPANAGDTRDGVVIPWAGRSSGVGNSSPLQYSCLENPMDRGAWRATVCGIIKSRTRLSVRACAHTHTHTHKILVVFEDFSGGHSGGHGRVPVLLKQT